MLRFMREREELKKKHKELKNFKLTFVFSQQIIKKSNFIFIYLWLIKDKMCVIGLFIYIHLPLINESYVFTCKFGYK